MAFNNGIQTISTTNPLSDVSGRSKYIYIYIASHCATNSMKHMPYRGSSPSVRPLTPLIELVQPALCNRSCRGFTPPTCPLMAVTSTNILIVKFSLEKVYMKQRRVLQQGCQLQHEISVCIQWSFYLDVHIGLS